MLPLHKQRFVSVYAYHFNHGIYAEVQGSYTRGFNLHYIDGSSRWNETIKLGYTF